jgi:hypothetical protein
MTAESRVTAYLDDVARMLAGIDPRDRAEILAGLREHIDASLAGLDRPVDDSAVQHVLAELGPADQVAGAALAASSPAPGPYIGPTAAAGLGRPALSQPWVPVTVGLLTALTAGLYLLVLAASIALLMAEQPAPPLPGAMSSETSAPLLPASYDIVWSVLAPLPLVGVPWLISTILLASSDLWAWRQKWSGVLLVPALAVTCGAFTWLGSLVPPGVTRSVVVVVVGVAVAVVAVGLVMRLWRDGARRAREWAPAYAPV